jgi:hypothetical protein
MDLSNKEGRNFRCLTLFEPALAEWPQDAPSPISGQTGDPIPWLVKESFCPPNKNIS